MNDLQNLGVVPGVLISALLWRFVYILLDDNANMGVLGPCQQCLNANPDVH